MWPFLLLLLPVAVQAVQAPKLLWPLGNETKAWEVLHQVDAQIPRLNETVSFTANKPGLPYAAIQLKASHKRDLVEVVVPNSISLPQFSISVLLNLPSLRDYLALLRYRAQQYAGFYDIVMKYTFPYSGVSTYSIRVELTGVSGTFEARFVLSQQLAVNTWYHLVLTWAGGKTVKVILNGVSLAMATPDSNIAMTSLSLPGSLMLGSLDSWESEQYRMVDPVTVSCLALFDVVLTTTTFSDAITACQANWPTPLSGSGTSAAPTTASTTTAPTTTAPTTTAPTTTAPTTTAPTTTAPTTTASTTTVAETAVTPVHLFPLNNVSFGRDVMTNMSSPSPDYTPFFRFAPPFPDLSAPATLMDGSPLSSLDARVKMRVFQGDYSVALLLQPNVTSGGVLWQVSSPTPWSGLSRLELLLSGPNLTFSIFDVTGECGSVVAADVITPMKWHVVVASRKRISKHVTLWINGIVFSAQDGCTPNTNVAALGDMRIGGALSRDQNVRAVLQCLAVYDVAIDGAVGQAAIDACREAESKAKFPDDGTDVTPTARSLFFHLLGNKSPDDTFGPIGVLHAVSDVSCAAACLSKQFCRSFVREKGNNRCLLYDYSTAKDLATRGGAKYFRL